MPNRDIKDQRDAPPPPPPPKRDEPPKKSEIEGTIDAIKNRKKMLDEI
jgi:hypothetical protein